MHLIKRLLLLFLVALIAMPVNTAWALPGPTLIIDGKKITGDLQPVYSGSRLIVPVRVVGEQLGCKVEWLKAANSVKITGKGITMELPIGKKQVKVNGVNKTIDSPAVLLKNRAYTPIRFIAENLGGKVSWDKKSETATIVSKQSTGTTTTNNDTISNGLPSDLAELPPSPGTGTPSNTNDNGNHDSNTVDANTNINTNTGGTTIVTPPPALPSLPDDAVLIDTASLDSTANGMSAYMWADKDLDYNIKSDDEKGVLLRFDNAYLKTGNKSFSPAKGGISKIEFKQKSVDPPVVELEISSDGKIPYTITTEKNTKTFGLFIPYQLINIEQKDIQGREGYSLTVNGDVECSASQTSSKVYTLIFENTINGMDEEVVSMDEDLVSEVKISKTGSNGNSTQVDFILNRPVWGRLSVGETSRKINVDFSPALIKLESDVQKSKVVLTFTSSGEIGSGYRVGYSDDGIQVSFPFMSWDAGKEKISIDSDIADEISKIRDTSHPKSLILQIDTSVRSKYNVKRIDENTIEMEIYNEKATIDKNIGGKLIVLDPGHGGKDSGAVAIDGNYEKDYNLAVANFLYGKLDSAGADVRMTREDDTYLSLEQRTTFANGLGADIFISVHHNSSTNPNASGTETYYYSNATESQRLAKLIVDSVTSSVGMTNRGDKSNMFYVVNHTQMPAALIEVAFVSNSSDNNRAQDPDFQESVAEAMYQAILDYFSE